MEIFFKMQAEEPSILYDNPYMNIRSVKIDQRGNLDREVSIAPHKNTHKIGYVYKSATPNGKAAHHSFPYFT
jgi:hypothetical protein